MNIYCKIFIVLLTLYLSVTITSQTNNEDKKQRTHLISPVPLFGTEQFAESEFNVIGSDDEREDILSKMNRETGFGVTIVNGELVLKRLKKSKYKYSFDVGDGRLEVVNRGEFGGTMSFVAYDKPKKKEVIFEGNVNFIFEFQERIYVLTGLAHLSFDFNSALYVLVREKRDISLVKVLHLDSAPEAMTIHKDKIYIAGSRTFTVLKNFRNGVVLRKLLVLGIMPWWELDPNSVAIKNEDEIYVGLRGGFAKISLSSTKVRYFHFVKKR